MHGQKEIVVYYIVCPNDCTGSKMVSYKPLLLGRLLVHVPEHRLPACCGWQVP